MKIDNHMFDGTEFTLRQPILIVAGVPHSTATICFLFITTSMLQRVAFPCIAYAHFSVVDANATWLFCMLTGSTCLSIRVFYCHCTRGRSRIGRWIQLTYVCAPVLVYN